MAVYCVTHSLVQYKGPLKADSRLVRNKSYSYEDRPMVIWAIQRFQQRGNLSVFIKKHTKIFTETKKPRLEMYRKNAFELV